MLSLNLDTKNDVHGFKSGAIILYIKESLALQKIGQSVEEEFCAQQLTAQALSLIQSRSMAMMVIHSTAIT